MSVRTKTKLERHGRCSVFEPRNAYCVFCTVQLRIPAQPGQAYASSTGTKIVFNSNQHVVKETITGLDGTLHRGTRSIFLSSNQAQRVNERFVKMHFAGHVT